MPTALNTTPVEVDYASYFSPEANRRSRGKLRGLQKYMKPGVISVSLLFHQDQSEKHAHGIVWRRSASRIDMARQRPHRLCTIQQKVGLCPRV